MPKSICLEKHRNGTYALFPTEIKFFFLIPYFLKKLFLTDLMGTNNLSIPKPFISLE
jgi:hypothetical protein